MDRRKGLCFLGENEQLKMIISPIYQTGLSQRLFFAIETPYSRITIHKNQYVCVDS